jgi:hypothetical protein
MGYTVALPRIGWAFKTRAVSRSSYSAHLPVYRYAAYLDYILSVLQTQGEALVNVVFSLPIKGYRKTGRFTIATPRIGWAFKDPGCRLESSLGRLPRDIFCSSSKPMVVFGVPHDFFRPLCLFTVEEIYMGYTVALPRIGWAFKTRAVSRRSYTVNLPMHRYACLMMQDFSSLQ